MSTPFDFIKDIQYGKNDLMETDADEKDYVPFVVNRTLSYSIDTVLFANEMNRLPFIDRKLQYHYLLHSVRQRKRHFIRWEKYVPSEDLLLIQKVYHLSRAKATAILDLFTPQDLLDLKEYYTTGGVTNRKGLKKSK